MGRNGGRICRESGDGGRATHRRRRHPLAEGAGALRTEGNGRLCRTRRQSGTQIGGDFRFHAACAGAAHTHGHRRGGTYRADAGNGKARRNGDGYARCRQHGRIRQSGDFGSEHRSAQQSGYPHQRARPERPRRIASADGRHGSGRVHAQARCCPRITTRS